MFDYLSFVFASKTTYFGTSTQIITTSLLYCPPSPLNHAHALCTVANMFLIPMGMMMGANISIGRMFAAILMATLGNIVGGGFFVGAIYWYVFDSMASTTLYRFKIRQAIYHNRSDPGNNDDNNDDEEEQQHNSPVSISTQVSEKAEV